ncbi:hypothetical protein [Gymnodinialimonas ulvae]|uniref:hypothetical protein n=1 Tax=Gymnodinialimonas ulvae TaxID=3126504 RepID=UPI0030EEA4BA
MAQYGWTGTATALGGFEVIPSDTPRWFAPMAIGALALLYTLRILASATGKGVYEKLSRWLAFAILIGAFAVAFALSGAGAVTLALGFAGALAGAVAGLGAVTVAVAFALLIALGYATRNRMGIAAYFALTTFEIAAALFALKYAEIQAGLGLWLVFLLILPLVNAVFDWLSYGFTLLLLTLGFRWKGPWPALFGLLDLVVALMMFGLLSLAFLAVLAVADALSPDQIFDIAHLLDVIEADPWKQGWLIAMIASTLLPIAVHFTIGALSLMTYTPHRWIRRLNIISARGEPLSIFLGTLGLPFVTFVCVAIPMTLVGGVGYPLWTHGTALRHGYVQTLRDIAQGFGWL